LAIESDCGNATRKRPGIATRPFESLDEERLLFAGGFAFVLFIFICIRIEELVRVCSFVDVVAIDGRSGVQRLAACLTLGFVSGAGNVQRDRRGDFSVQRDGDFADADGLDRSLELDLATADLEACFVQNLGDVARGDRTIELAGFSSGANNDELLSVELLSNGFSFLLTLKVAGLELDALRFELLAVGFVGTKSLALGQQEVTRKAVLDLDHVAHLPEAGNTFQENDVHFRFLSGGKRRIAFRQARKLTVETALMFAVLPRQLGAAQRGSVFHGTSESSILLRRIFMAVK